MIGICHESKSRWEARVPLIPEDMEALRREHSVEFKVESSPTRAFPDAEFVRVGAAVSADIDDCPIILGVKEIPPENLLPEKTYVFFSHTIKGQDYNMPLLRRLMELKCQLIDYERIADEEGRRLVFFGRFAGLAGMIDTLWALGQRFKHEGLDTPFEVIRQAHKYKTLEKAKAEIAEVGARIRTHGLPEACRPLVCGFAGYGQVSQGAQEIYDLLPVEEVAPAALTSVKPAGNVCYKTEFHESDMVTRIDANSPFDLQEYYDYPERYRGMFAGYLPHLTVLVTGIYWEPKYPRLVTFESLRELYGQGQPPRLRVIGDISCDIEGAVQCTLHVTEPDNPIFVYDPSSGNATDGVAGNGPVILAVDHLPCELPVDASTYFSKSLSPFVPSLDRANFRLPLADSGLPPELIRATIVYQGELTEPYRYLEEFLAQ